MFLFWFILSLFVFFSYLPGKEVWDDYRAEILDEKLIEIGYGSSNQDENVRQDSFLLLFPPWCYPSSTLSP